MSHRVEVPPRGRTLLFVTSARCSVCRVMKPVLHTVVEGHPEVTVVEIDIGRVPEEVVGLGVKGTPTLIGMVDGNEVFRVTGRRTRDELERLVGSLIAGRQSGSRAGRIDVLLRVGTGVVLTVAGLVAGPTWFLVALGVAIAGWGIWGGRRDR